MIYGNASVYCSYAVSAHRKTCAITPLARHNSTFFSQASFCLLRLSLLFPFTALRPVSSLPFSRFCLLYLRQDKSHTCEQQSSRFSHPYDLQSGVTLGIWAGSIKPSGPVILNYSFVLQWGASLQSPTRLPTADCFVTLFATAATALNPQGIKMQIPAPKVALC